MKKVAQGNAPKQNKKKISWRFLFYILFYWSALFKTSLAYSGEFEISLGFNFNQSNYSADNYNWKRSWGASVGYYLFDIAQIELAFQDIIERTVLTGWEDTTIHDQIYSLSWVQSLAPRSFPLQPVLRVGVGQQNRDANGTYAWGSGPSKSVDSFILVLGAGLKVKVTRFLGIRGDIVTYIPTSDFSKWKDNISANLGLSVYF